MGISPIAYPLTTNRNLKPLNMRRIYLLEEQDLHTAKPPERHIKHELNAHLSTSCIATSSPLVSSKWLREVDLHYRSFSKETH